jgi:serine protease Do
MRGINKQFLRENFLGLSLALLGVGLLALAGVMRFAHQNPVAFVLADGRGLDGPDIDILEQQNKAYERIAQSITPAIVSIQSTQVIKVNQSPFFMDPFFRQFFGDMLPQLGIPREQKEHALGSGVIVSPEGYILTNNHVIRNASSIDVLLSDKRTFKGKVVGADQATDIAVLKIDARDLPTAPLGDSSTLHVGDTVMAFGNPFGLNFTVTRGTVSALGRSGLRIEDFESFIQTDAAINPGNSGGALVNVRAQVVGINTAILSGNSGPGGEGGFIGIGFAIPINMARHVMESLVKTGKVTRGYLGAYVSDLDEGLAKEFKVPDTAGALIQNVSSVSPAEKAGLKSGDVVRKFNGQTVSGAGQLTSMVTNTDPGTTASLEILRNGEPLKLKVTLGERPSNISEQPDAGNAPSEGTLRGITVQNLTPNIRQQLDLPSEVHGVVVTNIDPESPAASVLQQGDVIESIDRQPVRNIEEFNRLAAQAKGRALLRINRQGMGMFIVISQ